MGKILNIVIIVVLLGGLGWWFYASTQPEPLETKENTATFTFFCDDSGESITATFHIPEDDSVDIELSDGRKMNLPHTKSGSGARYANSDESFVFWNKGTTAFFEEKGSITFANCEIKN